MPPKKLSKSVWPRELIRSAITHPAFLYSGVRKIIQDLTWEIKALPNLTYGDLGYGHNKHKQLLRNYYDGSEVDRVLEVLSKRAKQSFTSVALRLQNKAKDQRSQGHCMQTLIISRTKNVETVELQYRSTELVQKFGGDLVFLRFLFEELKLNPQIIRFRFANAYLSGVFFPTLCRWWDPIEFLEYLWSNDQKLFAGGTRFFLRSAYKEDQFFPYSPENLQHQFGWKHLDMPRIAEYLEKKHLEFGKPLPKIHYDKHSEYQPKRKQ